MLMNEIYGAVEGKGLNVYAGFLHQDRERHPTVASDMMEEAKRSYRFGGYEPYKRL